MTLNNRENFLKCWDKFSKNLRGKILNQTDKQNFSFHVLKLILAEAVTVWENKYDECGRWLIDYSKENPEKGELIKQILLRDMKFTEVTVKKSNSRNAALLASVGVAAAGFGISHFLNAGTAATVAATVLPAIAAYPTVTATTNAVNGKKESNTLDAYMNQLEKFRLSILNVIDN